MPLDEARRQLTDRIDKGHAISHTGSPITGTVEFRKRQDAFYTWDDYNAAWLEKNVGKRIATEYRLSVGPTVAAALFWDQVRSFENRVQRRIRDLTSILERLELWADRESGADPQVAPEVGATPDPPPDAPIFVVHGSDLGRAHEVARVLERGTGRDVVILHERPNAGRTVIEKLERNAEHACFAVVVLTGDDEGRKRDAGADLRPRGRQNVIFELGFFFALLGRARVVVLVGGDVEHPSDIAGLVYEPLDAAGAWKRRLASELRTAGIEVDEARIP